MRKLAFAAALAMGASFSFGGMAIAAPPPYHHHRPPPRHCHYKKVKQWHHGRPVWRTIKVCR